MMTKTTDCQNLNKPVVFIMPRHSGESAMQKAYGEKINKIASEMGVSIFDENGNLIPLSKFFQIILEKKLEGVKHEK